MFQLANIIMSGFSLLNGVINMGFQYAAQVSQAESQTEMAKKSAETEKTIANGEIEAEKTASTIVAQANNVDPNAIGDQKEKNADRKGRIDAAKAAVIAKANEQRNGYEYGATV